MITTPTLTLRRVVIDRIDIDDAPNHAVTEIQIDVLDTIHALDTGAHIVDGTLRIPITNGHAEIDLAAGTAARYRIHGSDEPARVVTIPTGPDPISINELPEATE